MDTKQRWANGSRLQISHGSLLRTGSLHLYCRVLYNLLDPGVSKQSMLNCWKHCSYNVAIINLVSQWLEVIVIAPTFNQHLAVSALPKEILFLGSQSWILRRFLKKGSFFNLILQWLPWNAFAAHSPPSSECYYAFIYITYILKLVYMASRFKDWYYPHLHCHTLIWLPQMIHILKCIDLFMVYISCDVFYLI